MEVEVPSQGETTRLLINARSGDGEAARALWPHVYEALREIARQRLRRFTSSDTLDTTALVHEAYLRLVDGTAASWEDRAHFFALASRAMRFILVDYARSRSTAKRGGAQRLMSLESIQLSDDAEVAQRAVDLIALNDALEQLFAFDQRLGSLVEYRFFGGLTYEEIASATGRSVPTVKRDWRRARAWLYRSLTEQRSDGPTN